LKLTVAQGFENVNQIYFPHNIDFRGRIYPIPPHLNHIGADMSRGLLEFSQGKPLGKRGLYWLKVHLVSTFHLNKGE
jgi:DNA-directed RNA polymerase